MMTYQFNGYSAIYVMTAVISAAAIPFVWRRLSAPGGRWLLLMMTAMVEWALADVMEISVLEVAGHQLWSSVAYFGSLTVGVFLFLFALEFSRKSNWLTRKRIAALFVVPAFGVIAVFTNTWHTLIWTGFTFDRAGSNILTYHHGPLYWVVTAYSLLLVLAATVILVEFAVRNRDLYRYQSIGIVVAALFPWAAVIAYDFVPSFWPGLDPAIALALAGVMLTLGLVRFRLLALVPVARELLVENMAEGLLVVDAGGYVVDSNPAARQLLQVESSKLIGEPVAQMLSSWPEFVQYLTSTTQAENESFFVTRDERTIGVRLSRLTNKRGEQAGSLSILRDITVEKMAEEALRKANRDLQVQLSEIELLHAELRDQAIRDPLTQLYNRRYLATTLEREIGRAVRESYTVSVVMLDVDHFKNVNDTCGHATGDSVLQRLGAQLRAQTRPGDIVCRYGGEEFLVVLPNTSVEDAVRRADDWRIAFEEASAAWVDSRVVTTLSLGVASFPSNGTTGDNVVAAADRAVYVAKRAGRNRVSVSEEPAEVD